MYDKYEPEIYDIIKKVSNWYKKNDYYMINVWCNVWRRGIACAKQFWYNVLAFEPAPETYRRLKINTLLSNLENKIETFNIWLWDENNIMKFDYVPQFNWISKVITEWDKIEWEVIEVPIKRFDDLHIDKEKITKTRLMIMDVEWFEYHALKWMQNTLKEFHDISIIIEIWDQDKDKNKTIDFMKSLWYSIKRIDKTNWLFSK